MPDDDSFFAPPGFSHSASPARVRQQMERAAQLRLDREREARSLRLGGGAPGGGLYAGGVGPGGAGPVAAAGLRLASTGLYARPPDSDLIDLDASYLDMTAEATFADVFRHRAGGSDEATEHYPASGVDTSEAAVDLDADVEDMDADESMYPEHEYDEDEDEDAEDELEFQDQPDVTQDTEMEAAYPEDDGAEHGHDTSLSTDAEYDSDASSLGFHPDDNPEAWAERLDELAGVLEMSEGEARAMRWGPPIGAERGGEYRLGRRYYAGVRRMPRRDWGTGLARRCDGARRGGAAARSGLDTTVSGL